MAENGSLFPLPEPLRCVDCEHADSDDLSSYLCSSCEDRRREDADDWNEEEGDWDHA